jgi:uncharacterized protein (TIGR01244 family)
VTDEFWVSPQISVEDVAKAHAQGFTRIINNRPDGESPDQPASARIEAAARAAGLDYIFAPVSGRPGPETVGAVRAATHGSSGKTLAFCRSGTRSIVTWALGEAGYRDREELIRLGADAGYDLRAVLA